MRKGYTVTYQMRKKQRQQREIVIQYVCVTGIFVSKICVFQFYDSR